MSGIVESSDYFFERERYKESNVQSRKIHTVGKFYFGRSNHKRVQPGKHFVVDSGMALKFELIYIATK